MANIISFVAQHVIDNVTRGGDALVADSNLFQGNIRPPDGNIPIKAIFVIQGDGQAEPEGVFDNKTRYRNSPIRVHVRGEDHTETESTAYDVYDVLESVIDGDEVINIQFPGSDPVYLGFDIENKNAHHFGVDIILQWDDQNPPG